MKSKCLKTVAIALSWAVVMVGLSAFAQNAPTPERVPIGHPVPYWMQPIWMPSGPLPKAEPQQGFNPLLTLQVGQSYEGVDYNGANCGCLPPDTNAAVGNNFVAEAVNVEFRVWDKTTGEVLLDEPLNMLFGAPSGGDPYVVYDDLADRWYVTAFDSTGAGLFLAVSSDGNPLNGFATYDLTNVGGFPDYAKTGYNYDAIVVSYNDFGSLGGYAAIVAIDKAAILSGTLVTYNSVPRAQFRAIPPAQMHGSMPGDPMWFVSTDGTDQGGNSIRVTKMTNVLSNYPTFTYWRLPVKQYRQATTADQPGRPGSVTVYPNTTTTQVQYRNGHLVTGMASAVAKDGFVYPKLLYYRVKVMNGKASLLKQGIFDPGRGAAALMVSVDEDRNQHLGMTWIESSHREYLSMWVGTTTKKARVAVGPGGGFFFYSSRLGDYSSTVLDPADGLTFWSANEHIGNDGASDIWRTHIASFTVQ